jgi:hypothetical protein
MRLISFFLLGLSALLSANAVAQTSLPTAISATPPIATPANILHLALSTGGEVVIELRPDKAPAHVARIKQLTRAGF